MLGQKKHIPLSLEDLRRVVQKHLPAWSKACASDADAIVMHGEAFGTSEGELLLFACAIKYAMHRGKTVHVTSERERDAAHSANTAKLGGPIYRETRSRANSTATPVKRRRRTVT
jgi:hypothetical protein